ncbi:MAG: ATP synthase F1 subunit delta [bacterium]|nr:ATP synthase F1 subunit delta [bacterium]
MDKRKLIKIYAQLLFELTNEGKTSSFCDILVKNHMLSKFNEIAEKYLEIVELNAKEKKAILTFRGEIKNTEKEKIEKELEKSYGEKLNFEYKIDENILGGFILKVGDRLYNTSLKNKLENLKNYLWMQT